MVEVQGNYVDCQNCDSCEAIEIPEDISQGTISYDGDEITFTLDCGQCDMCGEQHEATIYAKVHTVECDAS